MTHPLPNQQGSERDTRLNLLNRVCQRFGWYTNDDNQDVTDETEIEQLLDFILAEKHSTARDVCQAIVSRGPTDFEQTGVGEPAYFDDRKQGFNQANTQWRQAITEVEKEYE